MQGIPILTIRNELSVAAGEGMVEGITGDRHEGEHVMLRALRLSPTGQSLNSSSESIIHYALINLV